MHSESLAHMQRAFRKHFSDLEKGTVLEVGSKTRKPGYRTLFERHGWTYVGCDLVEGANVDIVLEDPFRFPMADDSYDAVISGQMMEHNTMFWLTFLEMSRVLKMGGMMAHIAPSRGHEHRAPQDCWRFYRDGMTALADWSGMEIVAASTDWTRADIEKRAEKRSRAARSMRRSAVNLDSEWGETIGVFRKVTPTAECAGMNYIRQFARMHPLPEPQSVSA